MTADQWFYVFCSRRRSCPCCCSATQCGSGGEAIDSGSKGPDCVAVVRYWSCSFSRSVLAYIYLPSRNAIQLRPRRRRKRLRPSRQDRRTQRRCRGRCDHVKRTAPTADHSLSRPSLTWLPSVGSPPRSKRSNRNARSMRIPSVKDFGLIPRYSISFGLLAKRRCAGSAREDANRLGSLRAGRRSAEAVPHLVVPRRLAQSDHVRSARQDRAQVRSRRRRRDHAPVHLGTVGRAGEEGRRLADLGACRGPRRRDWRRRHHRPRQSADDEVRRG